MKNEFRILLLEDSPTDAELIRHTLTQSRLKFTLERVETRASFVARLGTFAPDLILSDFSLPEFDGYAALAIARRKSPQIPFIFVTGTLGEEVAIETLKKGATDYVLKHRLTRLAPSIHRALREAAVQAERLRAESELRESHEQLRALSFHLQHVREAERIRIAREVHDELGQVLTSLKLELTWLSGQLPPEHETFIKRVKSLAQRVDTTIQTVRRIATELRPGLLDTAGLPAALEWQAQEFQSRTGIQCVVKAAVRKTVRDQPLITALFRIFQEALTNIIRHSNATQVEVRLSEVAGQLVLWIKDNGRGISESEASSTKSLGLLGMRERVALLGGEVRLRGKPGHGTTVRVRIPFSRKQGTAHRSIGFCNSS